MPNTNLQPPKPPAQHRFHLLDALRGIAAVLVVPRHLPLPLGKVFAPYSSFLAVDFFFCLSGFIVAFSYEQRLATSFRLRDFALTRMIRLYPLAIAGTLLGIFSQPWSQTLVFYPGPHLVMASLITLFGLMVVPFGRWSLFPLDFPMWTLFVELIANFTYGLLMRCRLAATWLLFSIAAFSLVVLAIVRVRFGSLDLGFTLASFFIGVTRVAVSFFLGVLIFRFQQHRAVGRLHSRLALAAAVAVSIFFTFTLCNPFPLMRSGLAELLIIAIVFPLIVHFGSRIAVPAPAARVCAWLGAISYPLYILHKPLIDITWRLYPNRGAPSSPSVYVYLLLLLVPVWLLTRLYDEPVRKALTRRLRHRGMLRSDRTLTNTTSATTQIQPTLK